MSKLFLALGAAIAVGSGIGCGTSVLAAELATGPERTTDAVYHQALLQAEADYKTAYAACDSETGSLRLECRRHAHSQREIAQADARARHGLDWPFGDEYK